MKRKLSEPRLKSGVPSWDFSLSFCTGTTFQQVVGSAEAGMANEGVVAPSLSSLMLGTGIWGIPKPNTECSHPPHSIITTQRTKSNTFRLISLAPSVVPKDTNEDKAFSDGYCAELYGKWSLIVNSPQTPLSVHLLAEQ